MLTSRQRAYLRSKANGIDAIFQVGKSGISPEMTNSIRDAIEVRELIKITVLNNCDEDVKDIATILAERTNSDIVQVIGKKIILYKESKENPGIEITLPGK